MKIIIKENIQYKDVRKHLPPRYSALLTSSKTKEQTVNIVVFYCGREDVVTSRYIKKAETKIKNKTLLTLYFATNFTIEAKELISDSEGMALF